LMDPIRGHIDRREWPTHAEGDVLFVDKTCHIH
jgi:hypothetical protein